MSTKTVYRLRVGDLRILYDIDFDRKEVLVFNILTAEQAHKNMSGFSNHQNRHQGLTFLASCASGSSLILSRRFYYTGIYHGIMETIRKPRRIRRS